MSDLSHAEFSATLQAISDIGKEGLINYGSETATHNVVALVQVLKDLTGGERQQAIASLFENYKEDFGGLHFDYLADSYEELFKDYLLFINSKETELTSRAIQDIKDYFTANSYALKSRAITYDGSATETGTGDAFIARGTLDKNSDALEATFAPNTITVKIKEDQKARVNRYEEVFEFSMPTSPSLIEISGNGPLETLKSPELSAVNRDGAFIVNHSFQEGQDDGVAVTDPFVGDFAPWVDSTDTYGLARYSFDSTETYRESVEEGEFDNVAISLEIKTNVTLQQSVSGFNDDIPCMWSIMVMRKDSCDATVTLHVGGNSTCSRDLTVLSNDTWWRVTPTFDGALHPPSFMADEVLVKIVVSSLTTGSVKVDTVTLDEMVPYNGTWWSMIAGQTPALKTNTPKQYVYADTVSSDSIIQRLLFLTLGFFLPHATGGSITIADP